MSQSIEMYAPILGMTPFVVIEMSEASDGSGDPALFVKAGGGAEEEMLTLPLLVISEAPAEGNPVAEMLRRLYRETGPTSTGSGAIESVVREFNSDWMEFVEAG